MFLAEHMDIDFSALASRVAAFSDVLGCIILSTDGLVLGWFPPGDEDGVKPAWMQFAALGEPDRAFLKFASGEVWAYVSVGQYAAFAVATGRTRPGILLDHLEQALLVAGESRERLQVARAPDRVDLARPTPKALAQPDPASERKQAPVPRAKQLAEPVLAPAPMAEAVAPVADPAPVAEFQPPAPSTSGSWESFDPAPMEPSFETPPPAEPSFEPAPEEPSFEPAPPERPFEPAPSPPDQPSVDELVAAAVAQAAEEPVIEEEGFDVEPARFDDTPADEPEASEPAFEESEVDKVILAREFAALLQDDVLGDEEQA